MIELETLTPVLGMALAFHLEKDSGIIISFDNNLYLVGNNGNNIFVSKWDETGNDELIVDDKESIQPHHGMRFKIGVNRPEVTELNS